MSHVYLEQDHGTHTWRTPREHSSWLSSNSHKSKSMDQDSGFKADVASLHPYRVKQ